MSKIDFSKLAVLVEKIAEKVIEDTAFKVQEDARDMVPYDTGQLHDSIQVEKTGELAFKVSANTDYAYYVHEGHVNKAGKFHQGTPYLTKPLQENTEQIGKKMKELMPDKVKL